MGLKHRPLEGSTFTAEPLVLALSVNKGTSSKTVLFLLILLEEKWTVIPDNNVDPYIAPTGTKYTVDKRGKGKADFKFDQGYGYTETAGKVVVMHLGINATDYSTIRIACGELVAASD